MLWGNKQPRFYHINIKVVFVNERGEKKDLAKKRYGACVRIAVA